MDNKEGQSLGLKSGFTPAAIWAFSIGTSIGWGSFIITCNSYLQKSGVLGTTFGMVLGLLVIMVITWNLQHMIINHPDAGGIYTFEKRIGGKELGFIALWFILLSYFAVLWANVTSLPLFARFFLGNTFRFGFHYHIFGYEVWLGEALLSICVMALTALLCIKSSKIPCFIMVAAALAFAACFTVCAVIALTGHDSSFTYSPLFLEDTSTFSQIMRIAAISPWAFIGFENISHFSEEYAFPVKKVRGILISSVIITTVLYIFASILSVSAYPPEYSSWLEYIKDMGNLEGIKAVPAFYAAQHYLGPMGVMILLLALFGVIITSLIGNTLALSRVLYAAGREGEFPEIYATLNDRGIPQRAIIWIALLSSLVPFLGRTAIGWTVDVTTLGATMIYGLVSHAVFRSAQRSGRRTEKITGMAGMVLMVIFILLLLIPGPITFDAMATESYVLFIVWALAGLIYFRKLVAGDKKGEYRQRIVVWLILLVLLLFASMVWVSRVTEDAADTAVQRIYEYHQSHPDHDSTETSVEEREAFLQEQADRITRTNVLYTVVSIGLFAISMGVILINYRDNRRLGTKLEIAEAEAGSAKEIADLREGIANLLNNMPIMSFSKDANTGKYIACNQGFLDYALKENSEDVIGLTDDEIFDREVAEHFHDTDRMVMGKDEPIVIYEDITDPSGAHHQFQTTKLKFTDEKGKLCILGMSVDETEMLEARKETDQARAAYKDAMNARDIYEGFLEALSADYFDLYYVDIETEEYVEYGFKTEAGHLSTQNRGTNFFSSARADALDYLYEEDQSHFVGMMYKEKIIADILMHGAFICQYRLMINGVPTYVNMKATSIPGDNRHIIIGINNVDSQVKDRMAAEKALEEEKSYIRMSALNGNLIVLYLVDVETEHYREFSSTKDYEQFNLAKEGDEFFRSTYENGQKAVYPDDLELVNSLLTRENVLKTIEESGVFVLDYRLLMGGRPCYIRFKAAMVEEDGRKVLVVGLLDVDVQVRHEQEFANDMAIAKRMATRDELTGIRNKNAYADMERQLNNRIAEGKDTEFAVVVCDLNGLKAINDTMGHKAGDAFIQKACFVICQVFDHSPVFRIGGDEFAVICQGYDYDHLDGLMEKMNASNIERKETGDVQIAFGMSRFNKDENVEEVFERADQLMYVKKDQMKAGKA